VITTARSPSEARSRATSRGQARNRELALERLRDKLAAGLAVPKRRRPTKPGKAARERRLESKRRRSERKRTRKPPAIDE
jgi:ribosome-associated protein